MRMKLVIPLVGALALTAACAQGAGSTPPAIAAKKAEAQRVLDEIAAIDERLNTVSEQYDGARVRLNALRKNLKAEQVALAKAKLRYQRSEQRAAKILVWMYTSEPRQLAGRDPRRPQPRSSCFGSPTPSTS